MKYSRFWRLVPLLAIAARPAAAQQLDDLLPVGIPGYDKGFGLAITATKAPAESQTGISLAGASLAPAVTLQTGYDSAPNGAAGSPLVAAAPSLTLADPELGLGAFVGLTGQDDLTDRAQNLTAATVAAGLRLAGATQTVTLAGVYLATQETGFALESIATAKPVPYNVTDARVDDAFTTGPFTITPALAATRYRFPGAAADDRTDSRAALTAAYATGGPGQLIATVHATQSSARDAALSATTAEALIGLEDTADALWTWRLLAGAARRRGRLGGSLTVPVLEAALDWAPTRQDDIRLLAAGEVDDPDQLNAAGYRLSEATISLRHACAGDLTLGATASVQDATAIGDQLRETITSATAQATWQLSPPLALAATYRFNDRQANELRAANEHILTLGLTWTP